MTVRSGPFMFTELFHRCYRHNSHGRSPIPSMSSVSENRPKANQPALEKKGNRSRKLSFLQKQFQAAAHPRQASIAYERIDPETNTVVDLSLWSGGASRQKRFLGPPALVKGQRHSQSRSGYPMAKQSSLSISTAHPRLSSASQTFLI